MPKDVAFRSHAFSTSIAGRSWSRAEFGGEALGPVGAEAADAYTDMLLDALMTPRAGRETKRVSPARKQSNS